MPRRTPIVAVALLLVAVSLAGQFDPVGPEDSKYLAQRFGLFVFYSFLAGSCVAVLIMPPILATRRCLTRGTWATLGGIFLGICAILAGPLVLWLIALKDRQIHPEIMPLDFFACGILLIWPCGVLGGIGCLVAAWHYPRQPPVVLTPVGQTLRPLPPSAVSVR